MAPEQASRAKEVDTRADLYSLGATLYACLTGMPPFTGEPLEIMSKLFSEKPRSPRSLVREVPEPLAAFVLRLLERRPEDRPQTAAEVASELRAIADAGVARARRPLAAAVVLITIIIIASLGIVFAISSFSEKKTAATDEPPPPPPPSPIAPAPAALALRAPEPPAPRFPDLCRGLRSRRPPAIAT
jgi:serine/threonine protein kinase